MTMANALTPNAGRIRQRAADPGTLMRNFFGFDPFFGSETRMARAQAFTPSFEVKEEENSFVLLADVPGVKEQDLNISLHNNVLTISGSRQSEERKEGDTYYLYERQYGSFSRSFSLPEEANGENIQANLDNGVLRLTIGKRAESKPRKINLSK
jgi:HSP20 family protein